MSASGSCVRNTRNTLETPARCNYPLLAAPELAYRKRAHASQTHYGTALKFCKIARAAFKSAEFK